MENVSVIELNVDGSNVLVNDPIEVAKREAEKELYQIEETIQSVKKLTVNCDKTDYALAASSGALCGLIDIFLVGAPNHSALGNAMDHWVDGRIIDFAKMCQRFSKNGSNAMPISDVRSAIKFLELHFEVPYDQRGCGDAGSAVFGLTPTNHHFKSLAHNPSILGLFFSILDQFTNQSHFVSDGNMIVLNQASQGFELRGNNVASKLCCGFVNWFGHLMSDVGGSSHGKGRGMGIPSPFWTWINDVIAIKATLHIPVNDFDKRMNEFALTIYKKGFDLRFQTAQAIPVLINEFLVRFIYALRRMIRFFANGENGTMQDLWIQCEPFDNASVKRMLTVAHGTFCAFDATDAIVRGFASGGGTFNPVECVLRLNLVGIGRFAISLYGEANRFIDYQRAVGDAEYAARRKIIIQEYMEGLNKLSEIYDDQNLVNFVDDLKSENHYQEAFEKSAKLAKKRSVKYVLWTKNDIDNYFNTWREK